MAIIMHCTVSDGIDIPFSPRLHSSGIDLPLHYLDNRSDQ